MRLERPLRSHRDAIIRHRKEANVRRFGRHAILGPRRQSTRSDRHTQDKKLQAITSLQATHEPVIQVNDVVKTGKFDYIGVHGDVAQLGEHLLCKQGVVGSIPIVSTSRVIESFDLITDARILWRYQAGSHRLKS